MIVLNIYTLKTGLTNFYKTIQGDLRLQINGEKIIDH